MAPPLIVGVDGSEPSLRAVDWAADEAALRGLPLKLVHASLWERYEGTALAEDLGKPSEQVMAENVVETAARRAHLRRPEVEVTTDVLPEEPEYALVRESRTAAAVVLGSRGRSGLTEAVLGSVGVTVAGHAHCPVIVLRKNHDDRVRSATGRVVLGVGGRREDAAAVRFAVEEARLRGVPLEVVRARLRPGPEAPHPAVEPGEPVASPAERAAEELTAALRDIPSGTASRRRTVEGPAHRALIDASAGADLLVIGARRREGHYGLALGRVARAVLHHTGCPVAVVPE
ncbi:universal stress protein [Streptomyces sp. NPDC001034]|uniref:universal stress protein n=1 Tax=Streptomyces sp. NPDC001034 TaxID=3154375 RepID=UPI00333150FE